MTLIDDEEFIITNEDPFADLSLSQHEIGGVGSTMKIIVSEVIVLVGILFAPLLSLHALICHRFTVHINFGFNCKIPWPISKNLWTP